MFLRFVHSTTVDGMRAREGFFTAAYDLRAQDGIDASDRKQLEDMLAWFRLNLGLPSKFARSKSKGAYRREQTPGLSWFKPGAKEHLSMAYELADLLGRHGYHIEILKTERPGFVIYEDDVQLIAEPFADTKT